MVMLGLAYCIGGDETDFTIPKFIMITIKPNSSITMIFIITTTYTMTPF